MKKRLLSVLVFLTVLIIFSFVTKSNAAYSLGISASPTSVEKGGAVRITVSYGESMPGSEYRLNYDSSLFTYTGSSLSSSDINASAGSIYVVSYTPSSSATFNFTSKSAGTNSFTVNAVEFVDGSGSTYNTGSRSVSVTVTEPAPPVTPPVTPPTTPGDTTKSSNNYLSSLTTNPSGFSPKFSKTTMSYSITVGENVTKVDVTASAEDSKAKVSITGNTNLKAGNNTCKILVTAENGSTKTYTLTIKKEGEPENNVTPEVTIPEAAILRLQKIEITNPKISLNFNPEIFEYNITLTEDLTMLDITATPNIEGAVVEILGNEDLQIGENIITILVSMPDSDEVVTYQVIVNKVIAMQEDTEVIEKDRLSPNNRVGSRLIAIAVIWLIAGIAFIIIEYRYTRKNSKSDAIDNNMNFEPELGEEKSKKNKGSKH